MILLLGLSIAGVKSPVIRPSDLSAPWAKMILPVPGVLTRLVTRRCIPVTVLAVLMDSEHRLCRGPVPTCRQKPCLVLSI